MGPEKRFEERIKTDIFAHGGYLIKYWGGGAYTKSGVPDLLACVRGQFLGVEIKAEHGRPSTLQLVNLKRIDSAGGYAILLYPKDQEIFVELLDALVRHKPMDAHVAYQALREEWFAIYRRL